MEALLLSTGVIFLAELGDKSQLMALTFATRFKARTVLPGITLATALMHAASVLIGAVIGADTLTECRPAPKSTVQQATVAAVRFLGTGRRS